MIENQENETVEENYEDDIEDTEEESENNNVILNETK
jgi:hypothetical protein